MHYNIDYSHEDDQLFLLLLWLTLLGQVLSILCITTVQLFIVVLINGTTCCSLVPGAHDSAFFFLTVLIFGTWSWTTNYTN